MRSSQKRLIELVHAHLYGVNRNHLASTHGTQFKRWAKKILQRFDIDILQDERAEWTKNQQARFYKTPFYKCKCRSCGFICEYIANSTKPNGKRRGYHVLVDEREQEEQCRATKGFQLVSCMDFRRKNKPPKSQTEQPPKKRERII